MTVSFITTTSHGAWLPGDARGYVRKGVVLPGDRKLLEASRRHLKTPPVYFSEVERKRLFSALISACSEFQYRLSDVAIESWHLHWILFHGDDAIKKVMGRLKTRMRQALARGQIWTEGYCAEPLFNEQAIDQAQQYIARHDGCLMSDGILLELQTPGRAGG